MTAAALAHHAPAEQVPLIEVFAAKSEALAMLVDAGMIELHGAVDELQAYAVARGLIAAFGQDEIQRIISDAFAWVPR
jgi:hypothetical protein